MYLNTHSHFSLRYGILSIKELLQLAQRNAQSILALTDINHSGSALEFIRMSAKYDIRPVVGIDFRLGAQQQFVGLARNNKGFKLLNDYLSKHLHHSWNIPKLPHPISEDVHWIIPFSNYQGQQLQRNEWIGIHARDFHRLPFSKYPIPEDKVVILHTITFRDKRDFNAHRLLRSIDKNTLLSKLDKSEEGREDQVMLDQQQFCNLYQRYPKAIQNTRRLLEDCHIHFEFNQDKNQRFYTGELHQDRTLLKQLCQIGLSERYRKVTPEIKKRLDKELKVIIDMGFVSYFLINWRITQYARQRGYFYVGRGSGANSVVAYILRITDVDPIDLDLYFERFINLYRTSPPDFDIDFSWKDREDITRFIFEEFKHTALLCTYNTFQYKAVTRELGKVFGLPPREIDKVQQMQGQEHRLDSMGRLVHRYGGLIKDQPSHLSVHAGGIVISEADIHTYSATILPPKGYPTTQFDMVSSEDIGLYKFDILSQRGLGKIKDTLTVIRENHPDDPEIDIHDIDRFKQDERIKDLLRNGKAIGCFYVESPAMRILLKKLRVDSYLGLVAASSVIRPGVSSSGMMREYILRFRYPEKRKEAHPVLQEIMPETFGVMVYQEDVIKVAHHYAGLTLGESDVLRRGMSGKFRSREEFQAVKQRFFDNCREMGRPDDEVKEIWRQTESFAGYAFAKGHSASYAVESYQSLFLKAYYPVEYMVATVNNGGGFYRRDLYLHEARMHGAEIEAPCVNTSRGLTLVKGKTIYLGFTMIKSLDYRLIAQLESARDEGGRFTDVYDFVKRTGASLEQLILLIRIGAFRSCGKKKKALLWEAYMLLGQTKPKSPHPELFDLRPKSYTLPPLIQEQYEDAFDQLELLGFPLCDPFALMQRDIDTVIRAKDLPQYVGKVVIAFGYLIVARPTRTSRGERMFFGNFLDRDGDFLDTVHFPPVAKKYPFRGKGVYLIKGRVMQEFDVYTIEVIGMMREATIEDPRYAEGMKKGERV